MFVANSNQSPLPASLATHAGTGGFVQYGGLSAAGRDRLRGHRRVAADKR